MGGGDNFKIIWGGHSCYEGGHRAHGGIPPFPPFPPLGKTLPGRFDFYVVFTMSLLHTSIKTIVNKFAISNHKALILGVHALRSYLKLICEYELHSLPNKKVSGAEDHGKNYIKVKPPLVRHLLRNRLLESVIHPSVIALALISF